MSINIQEFIEKVNVVAVDAAVYSGKVSRDLADDPEVFTSGSLKVIDPVLLRPFTAYKQAAMRACRNTGVGFLNGFAVPDSHVEPLLQVLSQIASKFEQARAYFLSKYLAAVEDWANAHPSQASEIRAKAQPLPYVEKALRFGIGVFKVQPQTIPVSLSVQDAIGHEVGGIVGQLAHEVAQDVRDTWSPKADGVTQKIRGLLNRVAEKCHSLAFLDGKVGRIAQFVDEIASALPTNGRIVGRDFLMLSGLMEILSDPSRLLAESKLEIILADEASADTAEVVLEVDVDESFVETDMLPALPPVAPVVGRNAYAW
jgi:hypothetical protein